MGSFLRRFKRNTKKEQADVPAMLKKKTGLYTIQCLNCGHYNKGVVLNGFGKFTRKCQNCGKTIHFERTVDDINMTGKFFERVKNMSPKYRDHYMKKYNDYLLTKSGNDASLAKNLNLNINTKTIHFLNEKMKSGVDIYSQDIEVKKQIKANMKIALDIRCPKCGCDDYIKYNKNLSFCTACTHVEAKDIFTFDYSIKI